MPVCLGALTLFCHSEHLPRGVAVHWNPPGLASLWHGGGCVGCCLDRGSRADRAVVGPAEIQDFVAMA